MLYNYENFTGFLYNKFKNNSANRKIQSTVALDEMTEEEGEEYRKFFKTCVVARQKDMIKQKLRESVQDRKEMMREFADDFGNIFNFYFASPDLVCILFIA